jgi:putative colanic acid biosynthesis acetyltransferase WcaF
MFDPRVGGAAPDFHRTKYFAPELSWTFPFSAMLHIHSNRQASKYTAREQLARIFWSIGRPVFLITPRPCFGLRRALLRLFGAKVGSHVNIYPSALIYFPWNLRIGECSSIGEWALIYNLGAVTIGQRSTISQRAHLCAGTHDYREPSMPLLKPPIEIGDNAWICADAFLGPGVTIGEGAIVGARAVVTKNVPPWTIVAGNPAKFVKNRVCAVKTGFSD